MHSENGVSGIRTITSSRPKKALKWLLIITVSVLLLFFLIVPMYLSSNFGKKFIVGKINTAVGGKVSIKDFSMGWLKGVDLEVPEGSIFGFLGRNGAGKTTTIKLLLGLLKPGAGGCMVKEFDSQAEAISVRRIVGYMAEDQQMYGWMRIGQIVKWVASFYPLPEKSEQEGSWRAPRLFEKWNSEGN